VCVCVCVCLFVFVFVFMFVFVFVFVFLRERERVCVCLKKDVQGAASACKCVYQGGKKSYIQGAFTSPYTMRVCKSNVAYTDVH